MRFVWWMDGLLDVWMGFERDERRGRRPTLAGGAMVYKDVGRDSEVW